MISVLALTPPGRSLGRNLVRSLDDAQLLYQPRPFGAEVRRLFKRGDRLIFITATGIAVRTLAPVLGDKRRDPPVLVLDEAGRFVVPLISGHEGGANAWGETIAAAIEAQLVLTTARPYLKTVHTLGMGCERGCPAGLLAELADQCLDLAGVTSQSVSELASIDLKAGEAGLLRLAGERDWPFTTWPAARLRSVESQLTRRSDTVFQAVGVYGVAEAAALVAASALSSAPAELVLAKHKNRRATCAVARSSPV